MKLGRRDKTATGTVEVVEPDPQPGDRAGKGRPTPKRREAQGRRGPVTAPKTRKEAYARQKQQAREQRSARSAAKPQSLAEQRAALRRGDMSALPKRDRGPTRTLARDWVDSRRMASNYLLLLFPLMIIATFVPALAIVQTVVLAAFVGFLTEWYFAGRKIRALAIARHGSAEGGSMSVGFYAGSRAYLPRRWRMPRPRVQLGDPI